MPSADPPSGPPAQPAATPDSARSGNRTLIRNAHVVFADGVRQADILFSPAGILDVDASRTTAADEIIDAAGKWLLPGVIDDQVHFREPGLTHKEDLASASRACAAGGVTTFLEMPNTRPAATTLAAVRDKERLAADKSLVNYGFYIGATPDNLDELRVAVEVPGIKIFIGSSTGDLLVDSQEALERIFAETHLPICAHCEDESTVRANAQRLAGTTDVADHSRIRDVAAAVIATRRSIDLATRHRHRFHVLHVSTADELPLLPPARPWITAEVCPHHLFFNVDDYPRLGTLIQMNPSIKSAADNAALWQALLDDVVQVVATDHAPHTFEEKSVPYPQSPSGLPAVENSLPLMLNEVARGRITIERVVQAMCDAPARVWGLVGKGRITPGYDADLVLVDPQRVRTIRGAEQHAKCRWSPWDGVSLTGWPVTTWVAGRPVFRLPESGPGQFDEAARGTKPRFDHSRGGYWSTPDGIGPQQG
ncbi:MAG: dihydroorotase [Planctomycetaceae bacterium]|nr:MAG: dihydroorotase [Planctomycetaceae bacterium]